MKFTCLQENLAKGINTVYRAVPAKAVLPIMANVYVSAEDGRIKLGATNAETTIVTHVGASIEEEGKITIPAKLIKEFISNLSQNTIVAHLAEDILHLSSTKTKSKFNGVSAQDYPNLPEFSKKASFLELNPQAFNHAIALVAFAASNDEARPIFTGVYLNWDQTANTLIIAAADGYRLSEITMQAQGDVPSFSTLIPAKTIMEVARIFASSQEPIKFALDTNANQVLFEAEDTLIATRIIDGQYPDYKKIIPQNIAVSTTFTASELLEAVKLTSVFVKEQNSAIKIKISAEGTITIVSAAQETGEHESVINAEVEADLDIMEVAFNSKYLLDALTNLKADKMLMQISTANTPCLFKPVDQDNILHVVAPMQTQR